MRVRRQRKPSLTLAKIALPRPNQTPPPPSLHHVRSCCSRYVSWRGQHPGGRPRPAWTAGPLGFVPPPRGLWFFVSPSRHRQPCPSTPPHLPSRHSRPRSGGGPKARRVPPPRARALHVRGFGSRFFLQAVCGGPDSPRLAHALGPRAAPAHGAWRCPGRPMLMLVPSPPPPPPRFPPHCPRRGRKGRARPAQAPDRPQARLHGAWGVGGGVWRGEGERCVGAAGSVGGGLSPSEGGSRFFRPLTNDRPKRLTPLSLPPLHS